MTSTCDIIKKNGTATPLDRQSGIIPDLGDILRRSIIDVKEFATMNLPDRKFILKPWLEAGTLAMIAAKRGVGKSWLALIIGVAVTTRLSIGGWQTDNPTGCLYIDGEMTSQSMQRRVLGLVKKRMKSEAPFKVLSSNLMRSKGDPSPYLVNKQWREEIRDILIENRQYGVLILDNLGSLTPGIDENWKKEWDDLGQWLLELRSLGVAVITVHHARKKGDQRGTSAREDHIDVSIKLTHPKGYKAEDGARFNVEFTKNREFYGEGAEPFCLHIKETTQAGITWEVENTALIKKQNIIAMLGMGIKPKDIAKGVGCTPAYVSIVKKEAIEKGHLDEQGTLSTEGEKLYGNIDVESLMSGDESCD